MDYKCIGYEVHTQKNIQEETRIATISDLNWNFTTDISEMNNLLISINDLIPKYIFILGNICTYNKLFDYDFRKNYLYFLELLSCVAKTYIVLGTLDYKNNNDLQMPVVNIDNLISFYHDNNINIINNDLVSEDINIIGFNKSNIAYNNIEALNKELQNLITKINNVIDNSKFSVLITNYDLNLSKIDKKLLTSLDLILTATRHKINQKGLFQFEEEINHHIITNTQEIIKTNGVSKNEICFVKIKKP